MVPPKHVLSCSQSEIISKIPSDFLLEIRRDLSVCTPDTHLFGYTFLHLARDVRVSAEREARIEVSEHTRYGFHVHAVLQCQGRECVPLRYNYDKPEKP